MKRMRKYQVWVGGWDLWDIEATNEEEAKQEVRERMGVRKLPNGTGVVEISANYYDSIVRNNQAIGIDISNM